MNEAYMINRANVQSAQADYSAILDETKDPGEVSRQLLMRILSENSGTEYGRRYDFAGIRSYGEYRSRVPVITYDDIAGDVERMIAGEKNILTSYACDHMNMTSGTVGRSKRIPMTDRQAQIFLKYNKHYMDAFYAAFLGEDWMDGKLFCTAQGRHTRNESGITIGDASSKMAEYVQGGRDGLDAILRKVYTSPVEATIPLPGTDARYIHSRFALAERDVTGVVSGFFTMVVQYFHYIGENYDMLIRDIETGTIDPSIEMPDEVRASLLKKLSPMPERARELREVFKNGSDFRFVPAIWPKLRFISGVGGDGFTPFANTLRRYYVGDSVRFVLSGITSSEGLWSIPVEPDSEDSVLAPGSAFMEFLPVECGDDFSKCVTIDQLEVGRTYELIVTSVTGLYRYRMSDAVMVTGFFNNTPRVRFMYRVNKTVNLAAEKTTEKALQTAAEAAADELGFPLSDFTVYPDAQSIPARYVFLIQPHLPVTSVTPEQLADSVDRHLREANNSYARLADDGRLQKAEAFFLQPETTFLWRDLEIAKGKSPNQLKPLRVIQTEQQKKFFYILREM